MIYKTYTHIYIYIHVKNQKVLHPQYPRPWCSWCSWGCWDSTGRVGNAGKVDNWIEYTLWSCQNSYGKW